MTDPLGDNQKKTEKKHNNQKATKNFILCKSLKTKVPPFKTNQRNKRSPRDGICSKDTGAGSLGKLRAVAIYDPRCGDREPRGESVDDVGDVGSNARRSG